ncbi:GTP-binding protein [Shewanella sp. VB17]|uniref:CobW family GTP-binding protein n=1 Tax=Shewanella sp. VB17 TaxID=2739432 RepID=UPI0015643F93|nr:GTP-binding protein [Shewanella sp. VB17]NRD75085.1 GTP-binding protein [Shewanella sp. VB17]
MILKPIPTNVITGFLGVGKTTFIKQWLAQKSHNETWAVLVNEFGEVGIDGALLSGSTEGIEIREVAGGCLCCAASVPMQVAVNQLIAKAKPDRLLIEPTGLGHPKEVIKLLSQPHYQHVIALKSTVCLVDARKISDERYRTHDIFNQQLEVADIIVATKSDLYSDQEYSALTTYVENTFSFENADSKYCCLISMQSTMELPEDLLDLLDRTGQISSGKPLAKERLMARRSDSVFDVEPASVDAEFDERGVLVKQNNGEGFYSCGWVFDLSYEFKFDEVIKLIKSLDVTRLKAVLITDEGIAGLNVIEGEITVIELDDAMDSRLEIISVFPVAVNDVEVQILNMSTRLSF